MKNDKGLLLMSYRPIRLQLVSKPFNQWVKWIRFSLTHNNLTQFEPMISWVDSQVWTHFYTHNYNCVLYNSKSSSIIQKSIHYHSNSTIHNATNYL